MKTSDIAPGYFSIPGAAAYTGFSPSAIRTAIRAGKFPARRVEITPGSTSPAVRIARADLDAWLTTQPLTTENPSP